MPDTLEGDPERLRGDLGQHRRRALPNVLRSVVESNFSAARKRDAHGRRVGHRGVPAPIPHARYPHTEPLAGRRRVVGLCLRA